MNSIQSCILEIVRTFEDKNGVYNEDGIYICDLINSLFKSRGIKQYHCDTEMTFEVLGIEVHSFSCCWIENGELKNLLNLELNRY